MTPKTQESRREESSLFESDLVRRVLVGVVVVSALALALAGWQMTVIDRQLRSICDGNQRDVGCAPHGVLDWEFAFTPERARTGVTRWREAGVDLRRSLRLDRLFIAGYVGLLAAALLLGAACFEDRSRRRWLWLMPFPFIAGGLDVVENSLLADQLEGPGFDTSLAPAAGAVAALKFAFLLAPVLALVTLAVARVTRWLSTSRLGGAKTLETVVAEERDYLRARRVKAGLASAADRAPIGLAFSGGGIRSATFNLGVLQALARARLLHLFDYVSTVSGGGYIGAALSSLLSINSRRTDAAAAGLLEQHEFEAGDEPLFSTRPESFPFTSGSAQVSALRQSSEFLVGRRRLFSIQLLRTVGGPAFGFLYHLIHFGLLLVAIASFYLWLVYLMVGKPEAASGRPLVDVLRGYFREVIGLEWQGSPWWQHPFFLAFVAGGVMTAASIWMCRRVVEALPERWYAQRCKATADGRQEDSVIALVTIMLLAASTVTWWFAALERELLNISLPLVSYLGGGCVLLFRHGFVAIRSTSRRYDRSRLAARQGAFVYLVAASFILVLVILPSLVFFEPLKDDLRDRPVRGVVTWLITVAGARLFAGSIGGREAGSTGLASFLPAARKVLLGTIFTLALVGSMILICVVIWTSELGVEQGVKIGNLFITGPAAYRFGLMIVAAAAYVITGCLDFNRLSLHYFYRDRLAEAYLRTSRCDAPSAVVSVRDNELMRLTDLHGVAAGDAPDAYTKCVTSAPYHLIVTCLNLTAGREPASRKTDRFVFSKLFCGSRTTGFAETRTYRAGETSLARAMTISGAAVSPAIGSSTFFAQSAATTLLNVRLGQWMENPGFLGGARSARQERSIWWPKYLLKEATAATDAQSRLVYLSDGGHSGDNVGICPLLERRCRLILAVDAEQDSNLALFSFNEAVRQARIDDGIEVEIDLEPLVASGDKKVSSAHCAIGKIHYPATATEAAATGWLILLKASMTGDESGPITSYKKRHREFPHQSTGDQFFDEAQFESYRELGEHVAEKSLTGELLRLVSSAPEEPEGLWNEAFEELFRPARPKATGSPTQGRAKRRARRPDRAAD